MDLLATAPALPPPRWRRLTRRAVRVELAALLIAVCLSALSGKSFGTVLVFSICISTVCWVLIETGRSLVAGWLARRAPLAERTSGWPGWPWMLPIVIGGGVFGYAAGNALAGWLTGIASPGPFDAAPREVLSVLVMALLPAITISYFFYSREMIAAQRVQVETAQRQAAEQQLRLLEAQLEPHMLFNTLANLRVLIAADPPRAQRMLDRLIAFLRASLAGSRTGRHPLAAEFERLRDYLALMEVRMGARLATTFSLPDDLAAVPVPALLLQPLVENSIKHGLEPQIAGGRIEVAAARDGEALLLTVRDDGAGFDAARSDAAPGYGLFHVRERLATLYGATASFAIGPADGGGTLATIRLPLAAGAAGSRT
jgi:signal transduction histidine kinase